MGNCSILLNTIFWCSCESGCEGNQCEKKANYCQNVTCLNKGICRSLFLDYQCECLSGIYSGRYCEFTAQSIIIRQYVSISFASIAITAVCSIVIFVIVLDILKYVFHIDLSRTELEHIRKKRAERKRQLATAKKPHIALRFIYVNESL